MSATLERPAAATPPRTTPTPQIRSTSSGQAKLKIRTTTPAGVLSIIGSALAALCLTWVLYERVLAFSGALGFWLCMLGLFVIVYWLVTWSQFSDRLAIDRLARLVLLGGLLIVLYVVVNLVVFTAVQGSKVIFHGNFWTQTMAGTGALQPLTSGGMVHALVGSLEQLGLATVFSVPLGVLAALFLVEIGGPLARVVRTITEAMTALPEIVAGLFIYALVILTIGVERSGFAASLALTVMMIPVVTRTSEVILRLVPGTLREASYALGGSQTRTVLRVILPTARSGLTTAVILAMARAVGETSPVLLTAGFANGLNANPFSGDQTSLPLYIFNLVKLPQQTYIERAFGAGLALMLMVLILFIAARLVGGRAPGELSGRQRRKLTRMRALADDPPPNQPVGPSFDDVPVVTAPGFPDPYQGPSPVRPA